MKTQGVAPVFQVGSVEDAVKFYTTTLGFTENFRTRDYALISHGDACLHLCGHTIHQRPVGGGAASIFCDEVDGYFAEIKSRGANVKVAPEDRPYGMRDFTVADPDGNLLHFGCECVRKDGRN